MSEKPTPVVYILSQDLANVSSLLPSNLKRSLIVHSLVNSLGLTRPGYSTTRRLAVVAPRKATYKDLAVYHSRDYLETVLDPNTSLKESSTTDAIVNAEFGLEDDCPPFSGLHEYIQLVGGATLTATKALMQNISDIAICWDGGRHHARKDQASGFCYVADCILAILAFKKATIPASVSDAPDSRPDLKPRKPRVMYLDLDLHFSDAVSDAFSSTKSSATPQVLTLSVHHSAPGFFPVSPLAQLPQYDQDGFDPFTLAIPLKAGASNPTYAKIWPIIERVRTIFSPDYVIVQCGTDALAGDPCAVFNWSIGGDDGSLGWCINNVLRWPGKKLLLGGGGYNSPNSARAWAYLTSIALDNPLDLDTEIPDHTGFPLYAPSFTLDVPPGNMSDRNTTEYLDSITVCYENVYIALRNSLDS